MAKDKDILLIGSEERISLYQEAYKKGGDLEFQLEFRVAKDLNSTTEAIQQKTPNMILVDHGVLGKRAIEICKTLKSYPATQHFPLLFITTRTVGEDLLEVQAIPVNDYIFLPLDPEDFRLRATTQLQLTEFKDKRRLIGVKEKIAELENLLERFPNYNAARQELSGIYEKTGQIEKAMVSNLELARQYYHQKNFGLAMETISRMKNALSQQSAQYTSQNLFLEALQRCIDMLVITNP